MEPATLQRILPFNVCIKYGAKRVICTWRSKPMGFNWPESIEERPLVQKFEGNTAFFKDGSEHEVDAVLMCTGYLHSYPFLREELRLKTRNVLYPPNLYKGLVWVEGGNNKLFYSGVQVTQGVNTNMTLMRFFRIKHTPTQCLTSVDCGWQNTWQGRLSCQTRPP